MIKGFKLQQIIQMLGRKPRDVREYKKLWARISRNTDTREALRKQRKAHLNHGFNIPSIARKYCNFCVEEGRM